jgi:hypothetical protein
VSDNQPPSNLPIFNLILPSTDPRGFIASLDCENFQECSFAYRGELFSKMGIRRRGQSVCYDGNVVKKFIKIRFPKGHEFEGQEKVNLQSLYTDKSLIREHLAWEMLHEMGQPYCTHEYVRLHANGDYFGLYAAMEHPNADFLDRNGLDPDGNLYKAVDSREESNPRVPEDFTEETNEDGNTADLTSFINTMHSTAAGSLVSFFRQRVEEDSVIDYQAAQVLINNSDYPHKNHFLYHDLTKDRWMVTSWDLDLSFGKIWDGSYMGVLNDKMHNPGITPWYTTNVRGGGTGNHLLDKFFSQAGTYYRRAYLARLWGVLQERYTPDFYESRIQDLRPLLYDEQLEDIAAWGRSGPSANDPTAPAEFDPNLDRVRNHVSTRRSYLINYLQTTEGFTGHNRLKITEIMYNPVGDDGTEYLELWNNSGKAVDVSGWTIEGVGSAVTFAFPAGTTLAESEVVVVARDPAAFSSRYSQVGRIFGPYAGSLSNGGEALRVKDTGPGYPATVDFVRYESGGDWPQEADGMGYSLELTDVSPFRDNDLGANWQASASIGGSPGVIAGITPGVIYFRRGDANADGSVDVSDALTTLLYLFAAGRTPPCLQSADADGTDEINLTDAVYLLQFLFLSGEVIPAPFPACGPASESGPLSCTSFPPCL